MAVYNHLLLSENEMCYYNNTESDCLTASGVTGLNETGLRLLSSTAILLWLV